MKPTLEIPDDLSRRAKATAALRGEGLGEFVPEALQAYLKRQDTRDSSRGWRSVFGKARREAVEAIDAIVAGEFEEVDPDAWR